MQILFTKNNTIVSRMIRRITGEPVSHVAIRLGNTVVHANFLGVHFESLRKFVSHSEIVYEVDAVQPVLLWRSIVEAEHKPYDLGGMLFLGLRCLFPRFIPKQNLWQSSGAYLCTEFVTYVLRGKPDSMITPYQLYQSLVKESQNE